MEANNNVRAASPVGKKRIEYIDAMRGFTMILVVFSHVLMFSFFGMDLHSYNYLFLTFRMPLFFFVSGFVLYKASIVWNAGSTWSFLTKKFKVQVLATLAFLMLFAFFRGVSLQYALCHDEKIGYWFTFALFEFYVIYSLTHLIVDRWSKRLADGLLLLLGCSFPVILLLIKNFDIVSTTYFDLFGLRFLKYFLFFHLGTLVRQHFGFFQKLLDNSWVMAVALVACLLVALFYLQDQVHAVHRLLQVSLGLLGVLIVFAFFRRYQASFASTTTCGRVLQYVGRRTLDIYFIHYFFLPRHCEFIGRFFATHSNPILELALGLLFVVLVISLSLLVSNIIRLSPHLAHFLLGVKLEEKKADLK